MQLLQTACDNLADYDKQLIQADRLYRTDGEIEDISKWKQICKSVEKTIKEARAVSKNINSLL